MSISIQKEGLPFKESGKNTLTLTNLRMSAKVIKAGGPALGTAQLSIWGMTLSQMNQLSTLGLRVQLVPKNILTISAGDVGGSPTTVFIGSITQAYADFRSAPDVQFQIIAQVTAVDNAAPAQALSYKGTTDAALVMNNLAGKMNCSFENNGVTTKLSNPYFSGSARSQAQTCADHAGIGWVVDNGTLAIWPKNGARGGTIPLISPATGMESYPTFTAQGVMVRTLFNPAIKFGGNVQVQSDLTAACGTFAVYSLNHSLDCLVPKGNWFSDVGCYNPKYPPPVIQ